jgi:hypothetical protein
MCGRAPDQRVGAFSSRDMPISPNSTNTSIRVEHGGEEWTSSEQPVPQPVVRRKKESGEDGKLRSFEQ